MQHSPHKIRDGLATVSNSNRIVPSLAIGLDSQPLA
jgi:hypothetical protein